LLTGPTVTVADRVGKASYRSDRDLHVFCRHDRGDLADPVATVIDEHAPLVQSALAAFTYRVGVSAEHDPIDHVAQAGLFPRPAPRPQS